MKLTCEVEVVYTLALGGVPSKSSRSRASLCLGKKPAPRPPNGRAGGGTEELYLIVSTAKNVEGYKYKVAKGEVNRSVLKFASSNCCLKLHFSFNV